MKESKIISINKLRLEEINAPYNPLTGQGSDAVPRVECVISDNPHGENLFLPKSMLSNPAIKRIITNGSISKTMEENGIALTDGNFNLFWREFIKIRILHDFEYWANSFVIIKDKMSEKDIPFRLNRGQRKLLKKMESLRLKKKPIRIILLKARQWGGSTLVQIYFAWLQLVHHNQWSSVICGHVENTAKVVRGMYTKLLKNYPLWLCNCTSSDDLELKPFEGSVKTRCIKARNCKITIGSAERPDNIRGGDEVLIHCSEVGLWQTTKNKKPEDLVQAITSGVAMMPDSVIVYESTAKGVGNFFHREWLRASDKGSGSVFTPVFVAWYDIDNYVGKIDNYHDFIVSMTDNEMKLFEMGATLEGIAWYRDKSKEIPDHWRFVSEFPSDANEAFQSTGHPFYNIDDVTRLQEGCKTPLFVGDVDSDSELGTPECMINARLVPNPSGMLKVWKKPDREEKVSNRYVVVVDIGGMSDGADNSVICIIDRYWQHIGGVPEVVAEWCGHIAHYKLAWKAVQLATIYFDALLVIESNTLESHSTEGYHSEFILDEIGRYYNNLFCRTSAEQIKQGMPVKWGFHTNRSTKTMVCDHQRKVLEKDMYIERCEEAVYEHRTLEMKPSGEIGATDGCRDDRHITRAIGMWVCYQYLPTPYPLCSEDSHTWSKKVSGMATF